MHSNWESLEGKSGISDVYFKDMKGKNLKNTGMLPTEHQLNYQRREKRENITILIKFCAIGSEERITLATGTQLTIKAKHKHCKA